MTKEYLKMADVFPSGVFADHDSYEFNGWSILIDANGNLIDESGDGGFERDTASAIAHAINSHDELVEEVERLRAELSVASDVLDGVDRVISERIKNGAYNLDDISAEISHAIEQLSRDTN